MTLFWARVRHAIRQRLRGWRVMSRSQLCAELTNLEALRRADTATIGTLLAEVQRLSASAQDPSRAELLQALNRAERAEQSYRELDAIYTLERAIWDGVREKHPHLFPDADRWAS